MISKILLLFDDAQTQLGYQEEIKDYFKKAMFRSPWIWQKI